MSSYTVEKVDAILLVTPEYNGSLPATLSNAIDWLSRPRGEGAITGRTAAVIGTSYGQYGGARAHDIARRSLRVAGATVLDTVEFSLGASLTRFADIDSADDSAVTSASST